MATRYVTRLYDRELAPTGLSANEFSILARLADEGSLTIGRLAERLSMDRSTLSRDVVPLTIAGLVESARGRDDRRQRVLTLTAAGRAQVRSARPRWRGAQQAIREEFGAGRTDALLDELRVLLGVVPE